MGVSITHAFPLWLFHNLIYFRGGSDTGRPWNPRSPFVNWSAIQTVLERLEIDVLILLDTCAARGAVIRSSAARAKGRTEIIAACGYDDSAYGVPPAAYGFQHFITFSKTLTDVLKASSSVSLTAVSLHYKLVKRIMDHNYRFGNQTKALSTPVHFSIGGDPEKGSIPLKALNEMAPPVSIPRRPWSGRRRGHTLSSKDKSTSNLLRIPKRE